MVRLQLHIFTITFFSDAIVKVTRHRQCEPRRNTMDMVGTLRNLAEFNQQLVTVRTSLTGRITPLKLSAVLI